MVSYPILRNEGSSMIVVGLMSGTSADGIDAAVVRLAGAPPDLSWEVLAHIQQPHSPELRSEIFACFRPDTGTVERLCRVNFALGRAFGQATLQAISAAGLKPSQVDLVGSHGQTLWHIPTGPDASTLQLGEPAVIAEMTGLPVISNFRTRDMAAGGQGAPLVAYVDVLLLSHPTRVRAAQNIGGIANVTYLPPVSASSFFPYSLPSEKSKGRDNNGYGAAFAFDTGPGNMLVDYAVGRATDGALAFDRDGEMAARGHVDANLLEELLQEPYLRLPPPKTTGRERFGVQLGEQIWQRGTQRGLSAGDIIATLTDFTAHSIAQAYQDFLPRWPDEVFVSGGGARNPTMMARLEDLLAPARVCASEAIGLGVEAKEAVAFAVLAYESWRGRPGNLPAATGVTHPVILGNLTFGSQNYGVSL